MLCLSHPIPPIWKRASEQDAFGFANAILLACESLMRAAKQTPSPQTEVRHILKHEDWAQGSLRVRGTDQFDCSRRKESLTTHQSKQRHWLRRVL